MASRPARRPNILLLLTDQHAPLVSGFAADPIVRTQALDAIAGDAVQFDTALCASPVCTPSRMCLMTAREAHRCAAWNNHWVIFPEHVTWPGHFAGHGYRTCLVGKMHFGGADQMQGFQHRPYGDLRHGLGHQIDPIDFFPVYAGPSGAGVTEIPESMLQENVVTRESLAFLLEHQDSQPDTPWFLCASYSRPHSPFTAPGRYIRRYRGRVPPVELPDDFPDGLDDYARRCFADEVGEELTAEQQLRAREAYYACVDFVDDCIGELMRGLEAAGLLDDTIVIYTSDHGEMAGHHGLWGKTVHFEPSVGVPLLMSGPGIAPGNARVAHPASLLDLFPTTCALAGLPIPPDLDGVDLSPLLADPASDAAPRRYAPSAYYAYGNRVRGLTESKEPEPHQAMRLVRDRDWKYVEIEGGRPVLFDMRGDPGETTNLAGDPGHAERCRQMRKALFDGFSWEHVHTQLAADRARLPQYLSGLKPSTPNQYMLGDGRVFDAEGDLYGARWLPYPDLKGGGVIPQQFG
ncbi:MAG: sulfatase-like hydrolase/transferase [Spirochaetaceae bacterium]|nr:sulfatase-like hydrolase/transferase [Spirochaetaceae bacterium]